jgi:hypothetical protein
MGLRGICRGPRINERGFTGKIAVCSIASSTAVLADGKAVDTQESGDAVDNKHSPVHVDNKRETEVCPDVQKFQPGGNGREAQEGQVDKDGANDQRGKQDSPTWEGLSNKVGQDDHGGHTSKDKGEDPAEQNEVVTRQDGRVGREKPSHVATSEDDHGDPLLEQWGERQALLLAGGSHIENTSGQMTQEESDQQNRNPEVLDGVGAKDLGPVNEIGNRLRPNARSPNSGSDHDADSDQKALSRTVEVAEVKGVGVEGFPCREIHGQTRNNSSPSTKLGRAKAHCRGRKQTGQGAVQRVDTVTVYLISEASMACQRVVQTQIILRVRWMFQCGVPVYHRHCRG